MSFNRDDFRRIRWSLLGALLMALAGLAGAALAERWFEREQRLVRDAERQQREVQTKLVRARDEEAEIRTNIERFNALVARGVIGEERRLDWVERIRAIRAERRLFEIQYELGPQGPLDAAIAPGGSGGFAFMASTMRLSLTLLHEDDLLNLLNDLQGSVSAHLRPRSCSVTRLAASADAPHAQLSAECILDWITIHERKAAP